MRPNINGIISCIILFIDCCLGSVAGVVTIFWDTHIVAITRRGIAK